MNDLLADGAQDAQQDEEDDPFAEGEFNVFMSSPFVEDYIMLTCLILALHVVYFSTVLVCFVIYKFEILRTRTNYILANFFISTTICATTSTFYEFLVAFRYVHFRNLYFIVGVQYASYATAVFMIILLAFDWYSSVNWPIIFLKWQKSYRWIVATCYFPCVGFAISYFSFMDKLELVCILVIGAIVLHFIGLVVAITVSVHKKKKMYKFAELETYYAFASAELWMFVWSFVWISIIVAVLCDFSQGWYLGYVVNVLHFICKLFYCFGVGSLGLCLFFLKRWDKHFGMAFEHVFKRSLENYVPTENHIDA